MDLGKLGIWARVDGPIGFFENADSASLGPATARRLASFASRVEELGYAALWMPEGIGRDPFSCASWLLANTTRLVVATGIANIYARDPIAAAAALNTLNEQSDGRFIMGLGVSHRKVVEGMRGHDYSKPLSTMRAYLEGVEGASYDAAPPPAKPRIVIAALREKMMGLAAERCDGAHSYNVTPQHSARARQILGPEKMLCVEQPMVWETDPAKARAVARSELKLYLGLENYCNSWRELGFSNDDLANGGSDRFIDSIVAWGDESALRRRIDEHLDAGASHVCFKALAPGGGTDMRIVEMLAPSRHTNH